VDRFALDQQITGCRIVIDDLPLEDVLRPIEQKFGAVGPGEYTWLPPAIALLPSQHLLGHPDPRSGMWGEDWAEWGFGNQTVAIGGCICGDVGCNPLLVTIELNRDAVVWRDFFSRQCDNYHLGFTFLRKQYESEQQRTASI
jgi:hypothetical protein